MSELTMIVGLDDVPGVGRVDVARWLCENCKRYWPTYHQAEAHDCPKRGRVTALSHRSLPEPEAIR